MTCVSSRDEVDANAVKEVFHASVSGMRGGEHSVYGCYSFSSMKIQFNKGCMKRRIK